MNVHLMRKKYPDMQKSRLKNKQINILPCAKPTLSEKIITRLLSFIYGKIHHHADIAKKYVDHAKLYPLKGYNQCLTDEAQSNKEWAELFQSCEFTFSLRNKFSKKDLERALLQRLHSIYGAQYIFAKLCLKTFEIEGSNLKPLFWIAAPPQIRATFARLGVPIAKRPSDFLWMTFKLRLFLEAIFENIKSSIRIMRDYVVLKIRAEKSTEKMTEKPTVIWMNLASSDLQMAPGGLNPLDFIEEKSVPCFQGDPRVFVVDTRPSTTVEKMERNIRLGRDPFLCMGRDAFGFNSLIRLISFQFLNIAMLVSHLFRGQWWNLLFAKDASLLPRASAWFENIRPKSIVQAFSGGNDSLWILMGKSYGTESWCLFHSTNCWEYAYEGEELDAVAPVYLNMLSDRFAVWDEEQKAWLVRLGYDPRAVIACGPIIYARHPLKQQQTGTSNQKQSLSEVVNIAVFDVIPCTHEYLAMLGYGDAFYSTDVTKKFNHDVLKACQTVYGSGKYRIFFKPKRRQANLHDPLYWDEIEKLKKLPDFEYISPEQNPISVVMNSSVVISMPFTSTAILGECYGMQSCYFDPTSRLAPKFLTDDHPPLVRGYENLVKWLREL